MAIQIAYVAGQIVSHLETLIDTRIRGRDVRIATDTQRCPFCDAIVPAIRPVPFEYCPYCGAELSPTAISSDTYI